MTILFNTKLRQKLLTHFFTHPDEQLYVREIAGFIIEDAGNLSRELRKLKEDGLFNSSIKGNLKLYSLNKTYPLFQELKQIVFKTEGVQGSLKTLVQKYAGITLAFIYGSYAKNTETKTSDIDLVVVGKFPQNEFTSHIRELESKLNREINFTVYEQEEFNKESNKDGSFLQLVLKEKSFFSKGVCMFNKLVKKLELEKKIKKQKAGIVQIEALLREAILDLTEAKKISHLAQRATYLMAYMGILKAGRALLLLKGYVPDDGAQHKTVVEMTSAILGDKYKNLTQHFESMRRKRNELTYEAGKLLSLSEAQRALADAIALVHEILKEVKSQNPQLELDFKL